MNKSNLETNKLQGKYLAANLNEAWTIDITTIKLQYYWFFVIDLASRRIIYHDVSEHDFTVAQVTHLFQMAVNLERSIYPQKPVGKVHTDSGGVFVSSEWKKCVEENGIEVSSSDSKTRQNQVSERLNRTFKGLLREKLNKVLNKSHNKTNTVQLIREATKYNFQNLIDITKEVVSFYNTKKPHEHLNYLPPDTWAYEARLLPNQIHVLIPKKESGGLNEASDVVKMLKEKDPKEREKHIQIVSNVSVELGLGQSMADKNPEKVFEKIFDLNTNFIFKGI